jgi:hypothetical protein
VSRESLKWEKGVERVRRGMIGCRVLSLGIGVGMKGWKLWRRSRVMVMAMGGYGGEESLSVSD